MAVRIELPEDIEHHLETKWGDLPRHALEALAMEGYRARVLSRSQVRRMLAFETGAEVDEFMKRAGVPFDYTLNDRGLVSAMTIIALVIPYFSFPEDIGWFPRPII